MYDTMSGVRILEVAGYLFVPMASAILADWGADVIKVEHPVTGDPYRGLRNDFVRDGMPNPILELCNHGKRSIGIDLATDEGRRLVYELIADADVFLTSFMEEPLRRLRLDADSVRAVNPTIVYARGSGYGPRGPDADKPGFDAAATWARGGLMWRMTPPDAAAPAEQPGSVGDLTGGLSMALGISAALFKRERTGEFQQVDVSLYGVGVYLSSQSLGAAGLGLDYKQQGRTRFTPRNPLVNTYPTSDCRWLMLCMLQPDPYWPDFCAHIGREDLLDDERFASFPARELHATELVDELDSTFRTKTLAEWRDTFITLRGVWAPALSAEEIVNDPQVAANNYLPELIGADGEPLHAPDGTAFRCATAPIQFGGRNIGALRAMPEAGQDTEEILLERGYSWEDIADLKSAAVTT